MPSSSVGHIPFGYAASLRPRPAWFANRQTRRSSWPHQLPVRDLVGARLRAGGFEAVKGAAEPHQSGDPGQQLLGPPELVGPLGGARDASELVRVRAGP